jgi:hypothetical protein
MRIEEERKRSRGFLNKTTLKGKWPYCCGPLKSMASEIL